MAGAITQSAILHQEFTDFLAGREIASIPVSSHLVPINREQERAIHCFAIKKILSEISEYLPAIRPQTILREYLGTNLFGFLSDKLKQRDISFSVLNLSSCYSTKGLEETTRRLNQLLQDFLIRPLVALVLEYMGEDQRVSAPLLLMQERVVVVVARNPPEHTLGAKRLCFVNGRAPLRFSEHILVEERRQSSPYAQQQLGNQAMMEWIGEVCREPKPIDTCLGDPLALLPLKRSKREEKERHQQEEQRLNKTPYLLIDQFTEYDISVLPPDEGTSLLSVFNTDP